MPQNPPPADDDQHGHVGDWPGSQPDGGGSFRTRGQRQTRGFGHVPRQGTCLRSSVLFSAGYIDHREIPTAITNHPQSHSSATGFRSVPTPSMVTSTLSPATSGPTPDGVPVGIKSPG